MLAEQTLINGAVLTTNATAVNPAAAGFVFNALLIARAPLQLFQAIQGSLLPHLAGLNARRGRASSAARSGSRCPRSPRSPACRDRPAGDRPVGDGDPVRPLRPTGAWGSRSWPSGWGCTSTAGTLNQAALARDHAGAAAACWLVAAVLFVGWMLSGIVGAQLLRAEVGYAGGAAVLCALLAVVYLRPPGRNAAEV